MDLKPSRKISSKYILIDQCKQKIEDKQTAAVVDANDLKDRSNGDLSESGHPSKFQKPAIRDEKAF